MLRAGHLVASSGDGHDSLLLLDWRGCPPDPTTFPALVPKDNQVLSALFKAFRFPTSPVLRFSIILTICETVCQPVSIPFVCFEEVVRLLPRKRYYTVCLRRRIAETVSLRGAERNEPPPKKSTSSKRYLFSLR